MSKFDELYNKIISESKPFTTKNYKQVYNISPDENIEDYREKVTDMEMDFSDYEKVLKTKIVKDKLQEIGTIVSKRFRSVMHCYIACFKEKLDDGTLTEGKTYGEILKMQPTAIEWPWEMIATDTKKRIGFWKVTAEDDDICVYQNVKKKVGSYTYEDSNRNHYYGLDSDTNDMCAKNYFKNAFQQIASEYRLKFMGYI